MISLICIFRCALPGYANDTFKIQSESHRSLINQSIPLDGDGGYEKCLIYSGTTNGSGHTTAQRCNSWVYDRSLFSSTLGMKVQFPGIPVCVNACVCFLCVCMCVCWGGGERERQSPAIAKFIQFFSVK